MKKPNVSQDDVTDVLEMTENLEKYIAIVLQDNQRSLAISALISATINTILGQCDTFEEIIYLRHVFIYHLDNAIRTIQIKEKDSPS